MSSLPTILAHGLGGRVDLPVPLWLAQSGAAMALLISFAALGVFWRTPRLEGAAAGGGRLVAGGLQRVVDASTTRALLRTLGLLLALVTLAVAALGPDSSGVNPAPTWVYVWFWVGLVPASLLFGPVWRRLNPLRAVAAGLERLLRLDADDAQALPAWLGYWPATVGLAGFAWLELVYAQRDRPLTVLVFLLVYGLAHVVMALQYGQAWFDRGDTFEVYSDLIGRLCPFARCDDGRLALRNPMAHLADLRPAPGLVGFVCVLLGSTAFDGLSRTRLWNDLTLNQPPLTNHLLGTAGLAACVGFVAATFLLATHASASSARQGVTDATPPSWRFVHSLVPIAVGYTVAHYFSFFVFQGQVGYILASDPLGRGWDLFGTADWRPNFLAVSVGAIALVQVAAIVTGHVLGVVAAHDRAVATFADRDKTRGQYPLLAVMVCYTVGGIALLVGT